MKDFLYHSYFENTVIEYITALGIFIIAIAAIHIFKTIILFRLKKWAEQTETSVDNLLIKAVEKTLIPLLYLASLFLALQYLTLPQKIDRWIEIIAAILITFLLLRTITSALKFSLGSYMKKRGYAESK